MKTDNLSGLDVKTINESLEAIQENPEMDASVFRAMNQWKNGTLNCSSIKLQFFPIDLTN
jgi:hypothetical protein